MRKGSGGVYDKWNISVVATVKLSKWWLQLNQEEYLIQ